MDGLGQEGTQNSWLELVVEREKCCNSMYHQLLPVSCLFVALQCL